jgi:hypothetical protein
MLQTYSTERKFAHDSPSSSSFVASILHSAWSSIPIKGIQLELCLMSDLSWQGLIPCYVQICSASNFVVFDSHTSLHVPKDSDVRGRHSGR